MRLLLRPVLSVSVTKEINWPAALIAVCGVITNVVQYQERQTDEATHKERSERCTEAFHLALDELVECKREEVVSEQDSVVQPPDGGD